MADFGMGFEVVEAGSLRCVDGFTAEMTRDAFISTLEETLGVPPQGLRPTDTRDSVKGWSSLTDVTILTIIFSELGIDAEEDLLGYRSVGELLDILDRKQAFADS